MSKILKSFKNLASDVIDALYFNFFGKFAREFIAKNAGINGYQSTVYPPVNPVWGTPQQMLAPLFQNVQQVPLVISSWDFLHFTSNATGQMNSFENTNNISNFPTRLDIHGCHHLIAWKNHKRFPFPLTNYGKTLTGLMEYLITTGFTEDQLDLNKLSDLDNLTIFVWPYLVKPDQMYSEDTTRFYGTRSIVLYPGDTLFIVTSSSTVFNLPGQFSPSWYSFGQQNNVLNLLFFFCGKIIGIDENETITASGNPSNIINRDVMKEVPIDENIGG